MRAEGAAASSALRGSAVSAGIVLASVLTVLGLGGIRLDAQGPYHDEIHQAPAAFTWLGHPPGPFSLAPVGGIATFTMRYSGAIKPALFGVAMRLTGAEWTLERWRLLGLVLTGLGVGLLAASVHRRWGALSAAALALLCATHLDLLLESRHDAGPVALGFLLRAALFSVWLRRGAGSVGAAAALGGLAGFAVYEKLHALVLVPAVALLLLAEGRQGWVRRLAAGLAGFAAGSAPVAWVHLVAWRESGTIWSLGDVRSAPGPVSDSPLAYLWDLATLGAGARFQAAALGTSPARSLIAAEGLCFLLAFSVLSVVALRSRLRPASVLLAGWLTIPLGLAFLPAATNVHHWVLGVPLIELGLASLLAPGSRRAHRAYVAAVACLWVVVRLVALAGAERSLWEGRASKAYDPDFGRFARHAVRNHPDAEFLVGQWGIGNALFCEGQGRPGRVFESYWWYPEDLDPWLATRRSGHFFVVSLEPNPFPRAPRFTERWLSELRGRHGWVEVPADSGLNDFAPVVVWRFDRRP